MEVATTPLPLVFDGVPYPQVFYPKMSAKDEWTIT